MFALKRSLTEKSHSTVKKTPHEEKVSFCVPLNKNLQRVVQNPKYELKVASVSLCLTSLTSLWCL